MLLFLLSCLLPPSSSSSLLLTMPAITVPDHDTYLATALGPVPDSYIIGFTPKASATNVHHLLVYGCETPAQTSSTWRVGDMGGLCGRGVQTILWAWALDAPSFVLPDNIAFKIGPSAKLNYLLLEIHYKHKLLPGMTDSSGVEVLTTSISPPYLAGIYLFAASTTTISPSVTVNADMTCRYDEDIKLVPFAFRTHTHKLGTRVSAWRERVGQWELLGSGNPQKPQMFYLMKGKPHAVEKGDLLHARCEYEGATQTTFIGPTGSDEMCNFYMMYYMESYQFRLLQPCGLESAFTVPDYAQPQNIEQSLSLRMPAVHTVTDNTYMGTALKLADEQLYITGYNPRASAATVHHLLLYGCEQPFSTASSWNTGNMGGVCGNGYSTILWAWALDAPQFQLPEGIAFSVGASTKVKYLVMEIHYKHTFPVGVTDSSGVDVALTKVKPDKLAGIYLFAASSTVIPPTSIVNADMTCTYRDDITLFPFAFRTHTHTLGARVTAWRERGNEWTVLGSGDPQEPQMFYKMQHLNPVKKHDVLHARCVFNSTNIHKTTYMGSTGSDEMCNFYMMYYMPFDKFKALDGCYREVHFNPPRTSLTNHNKAITAARQGSFSVDLQWTSPLLAKMGQVGGLSHTSDNKELVVFHRGSNDWSAKLWFNADNVILYKTESIREKAIVYLDPVSGSILYEMGANHFYMPHGIFLDKQDSIWVTDVGLHQVMKFEKGNEKPLLILGTAFTPGNDETHFCKPTAVVTDNRGNVYVSDGYCNARVVKFDKDGLYLGSFGHHNTNKGVKGGMFLVHDLTIDHVRQVIYVADRENGQVHVMDYNGVFLHVFSTTSAVYAVDYSHSLDTVFSVNITSGGEAARVSAIDPLTGHINSSFPSTTTLNVPHCITYIDNIGIFVGEISKPFHVWKLKERHHLSEDMTRPHYIPPLVHHANNTIINEKKHSQSPLDMLQKLPVSFVLVFIVCGCVPILYLMIVIVFRYKGSEGGGKEGGFQKLLKDYDESEEEDELLYERYHRSDPALKTSGPM